MKRSRALATAFFVVGVFARPLALVAAADDSEQLLTVDHYVRVRSTVPAIAGQPAQVYVRERAKAGTVLRGATLYADLGSRQKVFIDLACSSHNAMWKKNHRCCFALRLNG